MSGPNRNLSLMILPQSWDGTHLIANLMLLPNGDPTAAVGAELPFASAQPKLRAAVLAGLDTPPWAPSIPAGSLAHVPLTLAYSSAQGAIYSALKAEYTPQVPSRAQATGRVRKDLPQSYLEATGFQTPNAELFTAIDGFGCALKSSEPLKTPVKPYTIAWGEIVSYALRQPLIAEAMGLIYRGVSIPLTPAQAGGGGWIWLEIDTSDAANWFSKLQTAQGHDAINSYAARLPALSEAQDVFAATLFPTESRNYDSTIDTAQYEADLYLDGFAKVVHANQPTNADAITNSAGAIVPGTDAGIQIGWDDEQVTTWISRQIDLAQTLAPGPQPPAPAVIKPEVPFTVLGYRVDVRDTPGGPWSSLCAANGTLNAAGAFSTTFAAQDLCVEPTPIQNGGAGQDFWLPQYFAMWRGRSLVVNDKYAFAFSGGQPPAAHTPAQPSDFTGTTTEAVAPITLRYGKTYQFRTRLADLTGGGPRPTDASPEDAGVVSVDFRRHVPPKKVPLKLQPSIVKGRQTLVVDRPSINYPEMVFAGAADQGVLDALLALTPVQNPAGKPDGDPTAPAPPPPPSFQAAVLDPDVTTLEIIVEAQVPMGDTGRECSLADAADTPIRGDFDAPYRVVYTWTVPFDPISTPVDIDASTPLELTLVGTPMDSIAHPQLPDPAHPKVLPIPTGRNIRLRIRGNGDVDTNNEYFGSSVARTGLIADLTLRFEADAEEELLLPGNLDQQLQAFYLRNLDASAQQALTAYSVGQAIRTSSLDYNARDYANITNTLHPGTSTPLELLATALQLPLSGQTISAPAGRRIIFGAENTLRHTLTQDRSSITFSTQKDLIHHWIVVQRFTLNRDWTWGMPAKQPGAAAAPPVTFAFLGPASPHGGAPSLQHIGDIDLPNVVSSLAVQSSGEPNQRDTTELVFFSTLDSTVEVGEFPKPPSALYQLYASIPGEAASHVKLWEGDIIVPITENPHQIPQLVSAGIAESEYIAADDYSSTKQRQRALWFEFDRPPADPNDDYFLRVMNYGPDPLLISDPYDLPAQTDTPISLDPEPIRKIVPTDGNDDAGLTAMMKLVPSGSSAVHYLVPLPDAVSPNALDLFGFWTYELRCGHNLRSTAQGRFGRPFRVAGVQHPAPPLTASVERVRTHVAHHSGVEDCIYATADLAQTVLNGVSLTNKNAPQTQIWFLLYAQLRRADGEAYRNILLGKLPGVQPNDRESRKAVGIPQQQSIVVGALFPQKSVDEILTKLLLPLNTPLSVLAVELFNREDLVIRHDEHVPADGFGRIEGGDLVGIFGPRAVAEDTSGGESQAAVATIASPAATTVAQVRDPLGQQLGSQRILRTSPLTPVSAIC